MLEALAFAGCIVASSFMVLKRFMSWRQLCSLATPIDVVFTVGLVLALSGTLAGAMAATFAGLLMTLCLQVGRMVCGYDKFTLRGWKRVPPKPVPTIEPIRVTMPWPKQADGWK